MKKLLGLFVVCLSVFGFSFAAEYTYFYGNGCPHCAKVDAYMNSVDGYEKINIEKKEIYYDKKNSAEMMAKAKELGLKEQEVGVPFLVIKEDDGSQSYLIGDTPIIDHFVPTLGEAPKPSESEQQRNKYIALGVVGVIAIAVIGFALFGKKEEEK